ncbi:MAG TPA: hypothetical protein VGM06_11645 [Polyangiaceae bacterium]
MLKTMAAMLVLAGSLAACSSPQAALPTCTFAQVSYGDGSAWLCPDNMTCGYSAPGPDGTCHTPPALVCSIPCEASTDCTALGQSASCTSVCGGASICVPFQ